MHTRCHEPRTNNLSSTLAESIRSGNACALLGAGISMFRSSGCPGWQAMVLHLINQIVAGKVKDLNRHLGPHLGLLFNETFFQIMTQTLTSDDVTDVLRACLAAPRYSSIHQFFAHCAIRYDLKLLTTNFDELIEQASKTQMSDANILKLHGTLSEPNSLRFRANSVFEPLNDELKTQIHNFIAGRDIIVGGYGGMDIYDVMPAVFSSNTAKPNRIFWIRHPGSPRIPDKIAAQFLAKHKILEYVVDLDEIMKGVMRLFSEGGEDTEAVSILSAWPVSEVCEDASWWMKASSAVCDELRIKSEEKLNLLWARLANHLRLYKIKIGSKIENLADNAYEILKSSPNWEIAYEARIQAAYMGRINGQSPTAAKDLEAIIEDLEATIRSEGDQKRRDELKQFLGLALHQRGAALQTQKNFSKAHQCFSQAISLRSAVDDIDLHYSEFQEYINARIAFNSGNEIDSCYKDLNWQSNFASRLESIAERLRLMYQMRQYGEICHNIGFVYQSMALDAEREREPNELVIALAEKARIRFESAAEIREDTRDPRMIVQSLLRLGEVYLMLASRQPFTRSSRMKQFYESEEWLFKATTAADKVALISVDISKEEFRQNQLTTLRQGLVDFRQKHFPPWYQNWLPVGTIATAADVDREAMEIEKDIARGWSLAVITAVIDKGNRVLMTKLGDYAVSCFNGNAWVLPGGAVDAGETPTQAAVREIKEETGMSIPVSELYPVAWICRPNYRAHHKESTGELLLLFGAQLTESEPSVGSNPPETIETKWIDIRLSQLHNGELSKRYGGVFPTRHCYWARLAQVELITERCSPRFLFYAGSNMEFKPWLSIESSIYEVESLFY